ncbi:GNAT family N-acetyltransferase [Candidatus Parabeggiatoa sp. HSG14]|uniref:GNAT family N-acetyltransferase n=1 Tax=Candidatus Parabeggiatoa sp. HSG14 TaxID=3055593 RepID=UPI0025A6A7EE|nr:GNAT family N-acetyltransferase [Thiotrichales bacterium HSG14]
MMIRECKTSDKSLIFEIINDAATVYKGVIPTDRYHEPYMPMDELEKEIADGISFFCYEENSILIGVMGFQDKGEVSLIRHAYVRTQHQNAGIGQQLLNFLKEKTEKPILIGTWADANWAIRFYRKNGFAPVNKKEKNKLLKKYWNIPLKQIETSIVLADSKWRGENLKERP